MEKLEHLEELRDLNKRQISIDHDILIASHVTKIAVSDLNDAEDDNTLIKRRAFRKGKVSAPPKVGKFVVKFKNNRGVKKDANSCVKLVNAYSSSDSDATGP
ncbi:hypothetical protein MXB_4427, partial [Myxobolus squamalis]